MVTGAPVRQAHRPRPAAARRLSASCRSTTSIATPSTGPKSRLLSGTMREYGADPIGAMRRWRDQHGDFVPIRFGPFPAHMAYGPAEIEEVLVERAADFRKSFGTRMLIPLLGNGLLTAEGDEWLRHRRLASPAFHRERVEGYGRTMAGYAEESVDSWTDGEVLDLHDEMTALTLRIVARTLFDNDVTARIDGGRQPGHLDPGLLLPPFREPPLPHPDVAAYARQSPARTSDAAPRRCRLRDHPRTSPGRGPRRPALDAAPGTR